MNTTMVTVSIFALVAWGSTSCNKRGANVSEADSQIASASAQNWDSDCANVAKNAVIGVAKAELPDLYLDDSCSDGGFCISSSSIVSQDDRLTTFNVTGEYYSGSFSYHVTVKVNNSSCKVHSLTLSYVD